MFELLLADILVSKINPSADLFVNFAGNADTPRLRNIFQPCSNIDTLTIDTGLVVDDFANINADAELHSAV